MILMSETNVPDEALPVEAFKAHLRLGSGFGQDAVQEPVLRSFLRAALAAVEARTGKILLTRNFTWSLSLWRDCSAQVLPAAPVSAVTRVASVTREGVETDVDAARYWLERDQQRPRLRSAGTALPGIPVGGAILVSFDAGLAVDWSGLPADMQQAVLMLAAHYYEYRHDTALTGGCMPFGVSSLIERFRSVRIGTGSLR